MASGALTGSTIARHLGSCNKPTRDKALRLLKTWLPSQPPETLSLTELKKIWKGLFYCVWHADKQQYQHELIMSIATLLVSLPHPSLSVQYFDAFVLTIRREWAGIDHLRLDKFYLLIRKFVSQLFALMKKYLWDVELIGQLMGVLEEKSLVSKDRYPAGGVSYHISEIYLDELIPFLPIKLEVFEILIKPFVCVMGKSMDKVLVSKIKNFVFDCLLRNGEKVVDVKKSGGENGLDDGVEVYGTFALKLGLSEKLFELGASPDCVQGNRKVLYGLHQGFMKLEKDFGRLGIEIEIPEVKEGVGMDEEVPELIPINGAEMGEEMQVGGGEGVVENGSMRRLSKRNKNKKAKQDKVEVEQMEVEQMKVDEHVENGSASNSSKKIKKAKKASGAMKKSSKSKNKEVELKTVSSETDMDGENENLADGDNSTETEDDMIAFNESVIANLQMQFEKVAAELGMEADGASSLGAKVNGKVTKKRKRAKSATARTPVSASPIVGGSAIGKSGDKSAKKVKFSMKSNLVWKPHSPLPPQSLRLPPSATPRGSALKKGCCPGPVVDTPTIMKKAKRRVGSVKKLRKGVKSVSPAVKRLKKLRSTPVSV